MIAKFKEGDKYGIEEFTFSIDYNKILERKRNVTETLQNGILMMLNQAKVNVVNAKASFKDRNTVIADGEEYSAGQDYHRDRERQQIAADTRP